MQVQASQSFLERFFKLSEKGTTVRTEIIAGFTTFIALAYIMFVNPNILADAGVPKEAAIASTIWIAALSTMMMGVFANYPVALAPGMGLNAFFAYYVCGVLGLHWTVALGAVFFSGLLFLILTISHVRQAIINAVPENLRMAIGVGIGLFIAFIGLKGTGLIVSDPATFITLGNITRPETAFSLFGLILTGVLMAREIQGAILIGIIATTLLAMVMGYAPVPHSFADVISLFWLFAPVAFVTLAEHIADHKNLSTIIEHDLITDPGLDKTLIGDGVGSIIGSFFGGCPNTTYGESVGCVAITGNASISTIAIAACYCIVLSFFDPFVCFVNSIPSCIVGGVCIALYGFIAVSGLKMLQPVDLNDNRNLFVVAAILVPGIGGLKLNFGPVTISAIATGLILGIIVNVIFNRRKA